MSFGAHAQVWAPSNVSTPPSLAVPSRIHPGNEVPRVGPYRVPGPARRRHVVVVAEEWAAGTSPGPPSSGWSPPCSPAPRSSCCRRPSSWPRRSARPGPSSRRRPCCLAAGGWSSSGRRASPGTPPTAGRRRTRHRGTTDGPAAPHRSAGLARTTWRRRASCARRSSPARRHRGRSRRRARRPRPPLPPTGSRGARTSARTRRGRGRRRRCRDRSPSSRRDRSAMPVVYVAAARALAPAVSGRRGGQQRTSSTECKRIGEMSRVCVGSGLTCAKRPASVLGATGAWGTLRSLARPRGWAGAHLVLVAELAAHRCRGSSADCERSRSRRRDHGGSPLMRSEYVLGAAAARRPQTRSLPDAIPALLGTPIL
jgi:hypothetical protein